jgi:hypothetical protein
MRDQHGMRSYCLSGNHHVQIAHRLAAMFESGGDPGIVLRGVRVPGKHFDPQQEFHDRSFQPDRLGFSRYPKPQLSLGDHGNSHFSHRNVQQMFPNAGNIALDDVAGHVGIEQVADGHQNSFRFCGGVSPRSARKSSGTSMVLVRSKKSCQDSGLRERMTSPVAGSRRT